MIVTYLDANVLIWGFRGTTDLAREAVTIIGDSNREFVSSTFIRMETVAKALYNGRTEEAEFYEEFFTTVTRWATITPHLVDSAYTECRRSGVNAMDALHIAAATSLGATELITAEKTNKSLFRTSVINVISIRA